MPKAAVAAKQIAKRFEDLGVDELFFDPTVAELKQVDLLAEAVLGG